MLLGLVDVDQVEGHFVGVPSSLDGSYLKCLNCLYMMFGYVTVCTFQGV